MAPKVSERASVNWWVQSVNWSWVQSVNWWVQSLVTPLVTQSGKLYVEAVLSVVE